jgi:hypothetical protein
MGCDEVDVVRLACLKGKNCLEKNESYLNYYFKRNGGMAVFINYSDFN